MRKYTEHPWHLEIEEASPFNDDGPTIEDQYTGRIIGEDSEVVCESAYGVDADLIVGASKVFLETGLTPRELLAQRDELEEAGKFDDAQEIVFEGMPAYAVSVEFIEAYRAAIAMAKESGDE